ncbi:MAG: transposase [Rhodospirillaceae bacterium]|nr:transposase [Rhodospirillaceae bacterium]
MWLRADNAYYRGAPIAYCRERGWDYSVSLTDRRKRAPMLGVVEGLPEDGWTDIGMGEDATLVRYRPVGWEEQSYVVIRRRDRGQTLLLPFYTVILVSRDDLALDELVRRHRGKQGQENAFKGPLIDLDLHHPPCRKFRANQAFYVCGQLAQMLLRAVQYRLLPTRARVTACGP